MYYKNREAIPGIDWSSTDNGGIFLENVDSEVHNNAGHYTIKNNKIVLLPENERHNDAVEKNNAEIIQKLKALDLEKTRPLSTMIDTLFDIMAGVNGDPSLLLSELTRIMEAYPDDVAKIKELEKQCRDLRKELK